MEAIVRLVQKMKGGEFVESKLERKLPGGGHARQGGGDGDGPWWA